MKTRFGSFRSTWLFSLILLITTGMGVCLVSSVRAQDANTPLPISGSGQLDLSALDACTFATRRFDRITVCRCDEGWRVAQTAGTDTYANWGSVCTAAAHSGFFASGQRGAVAYQPLPGRRGGFPGSERNGVTTMSLNGSDLSFAVRKVDTIEDFSAERERSKWFTSDDVGRPDLAGVWQWSRRTRYFFDGRRIIAMDPTSGWRVSQFRNRDPYAAEPFPSGTVVGYVTKTSDREDQFEGQWIHDDRFWGPVKFHVVRDDRIDVSHSYYQFTLDRLTSESLEDAQKRFPETLGAPRDEFGQAAGPDALATRNGEPVNPRLIELGALLLDTYNGDLGTLRLVARHADHAALASLSYREFDGGEQVLEGRWKVFETFEEDVLGGVFSATLFVSSAGEYVLAFRGTDSAWDWVNNVGAPLNLAQGQSEVARNLARKLRVDYPNLTYVGHSLGGRLAQVAAMETSGEAIVFDTSPLSSEEATDALLYRSYMVTAFRSSDDIVSGLSAERDIEVLNFVEYDFGSVKSPIERGLVDHDHELLAGAMAEVQMLYPYIE